MNAGEALYIGGRAESMKVVMNILEQLAEHAKYRTQQDKKITSLGEIKSKRYPYREETSFLRKH